jgi:hypothetical protein
MFKYLDNGIAAPRACPGRDFCEFYAKAKVSLQENVLAEATNRAATANSTMDHNDRTSHTDRRCAKPQ